MQRNINLHGALGAEFGKTHRLNVDSVAEVIQALRVNFPGFANAIRYGFYKIILGRTKTGGLTLRDDQMGVALGDRDVHIVPTVEGRKNGGIGKAIAGIALIGLSMGTFGFGAAMAAPLWSGSTMTLGTMVGNMGVSMLLTGVASLIAPEQDGVEDKKSFTMSGPVSDLKEGMIIPVVYGEVITGGYMISGAVELNGPGNEHVPEGPAQPTPVPAPGGSGNYGPDGGRVNGD